LSFTDCLANVGDQALLISAAFVTAMSEHIISMILLDELCYTILFLLLF